MRAAIGCRANFSLFVVIPRGRMKAAAPILGMLLTDGAVKVRVIAAVMVWVNAVHLVFSSHSLICVC